MPPPLLGLPECLTSGPPEVWPRRAHCVSCPALGILLHVILSFRGHAPGHYKHSPAEESMKNPSANTLNSWAR